MTVSKERGTLIVDIRHCVNIVAERRSCRISRTKYDLALHADLVLRPVVRGSTARHRLGHTVMDPPMSAALLR